MVSGLGQALWVLIYLPGSCPPLSAAFENILMPRALRVELEHHRRDGEI